MSVDPKQVSPERRVKVALIGSAGAGKQQIVKAIAEKYALSAIRAGEMGESLIFRTEFYWPEIEVDGGRLLVRLFGLSGQPVYSAVAELLVTDADGIVFVADLSRDRASAVQESFQSLLFNAKHHRLDLATMPVAFHYHLPRPGPAHGVGEMDGILGVSPEAVWRHVTGPGDHDGMRRAVEWVAAQLVRRPDRGAVPSQSGHQEMADAMHS